MDEERKKAYREKLAQAGWGRGSEVLKKMEHGIKNQPSTEEEDMYKDAEPPEEKDEKEEAPSQWQRLMKKMIR